MEDEVVDTGLSFMKIFGEYTHYGSKKLQIFRIFNITTFAIALWFTVANLQHATGVGYMKTIEGISTLFHVSNINKCFGFNVTQVELSFR